MDDSLRANNHTAWTICQRQQYRTTLTTDHCIDLPVSNTTALIDHLRPLINGQTPFDEASAVALLPYRFRHDF